MKDNYQKSMTNTVNRLNMLIILLIVSLSGFSQNVGINASGVAPNSNAGLDVNFTDKGMLIPRVALTSTSSFAPLSAHVAGMLVYNTATTEDVVPGFYYNTGSAWTTGFPAAQSTGSILYWDGTSWAGVPTGSPGQYLQLSGGLTPYWSGFSTMATLFTAAASAITDVTATSGGNIVNNGGSTINSRGVCWSTVPGPTIENSHTTNGSGTGTFTSALTGLTQGTTYYIRAYAINTQSVSYGNEYHFTTTIPTIPILSATDAASAITSATAVSGGNLSSNGNAVITERGICYSTTNPPTIGDTKVVDAGTGVGTFTSNLSSLTSNTLYYIRSYATNGAGTGYGPLVSFTSQAIVSSTAITSITTTAATSGGTLTVGGNASITERGVCWSTSANPTTADTKTSDGTTTGTFVSAITGLSYSTLYHVRAYATNGGGTVYGSDITFTTLTPTAPVLAATTAASAITGATATSGGDVTSDGGAPITERGLVWATTANPTTAAAGKVFVSNPDPGTGVFTGDLTGLTGGTQYHVRAYATNSAGTSYGTEITFITKVNFPVITTTVPTNITGASATSGGSYTENGQQGNYWNYGIALSTTSGSTNPTYISTQFDPPTPWTTNLTNLTAATTYYIRAYIQGSWNGVNDIYVYGNEVSFTTTAVELPIVASTTTPTVLSANTVNSGGNITSNGGSPLTASGVCWSTSPNPILETNNFTTNGTAVGSFTSNITGLTASTTYYLRAYATTINGTSYGPADVTFTTWVQAPFAVGEFTDSGIVGYVAPDGTGFIVSSPISPTAPATKFSWGCSGTALTLGTAIGTGKANTDIIIACAGANSAAGIAKAYNGGGFNDWYLPSSGEFGVLVPLYNTFGLGSPVSYYTSSGYGADKTYATSYFSNGSQVYGGASPRDGDDYTTQLIAIRDFAPATMHAVTTDAITNIGAGSATGGGNVTSDGGAAVVERGIVFGIAQNPTLLTGTKVPDVATGTGLFSLNIPGLTLNTLYYVRAYVTTIAGTVYGSDVSFTSLASATAPIVTTDPVTSSSGTDATGGGNVTSDGGDAVTAYGVCWSTSPAPTTADFTTNDGSGFGAFVSNLTGLTSGTTYYVRAYATNTIDTSYGNEVSFVSGAATIIVEAASIISAGSIASISSYVSNDFVSDPVTITGLCWSTTTGPTIAGTHTTTDPAALLSFTSELNSLTVGTTYYVRAYAMNGAGLSYSNEILFIATAATVGQHIPTISGWDAVVISTDGTNGLIAASADLGPSDWACPSIPVNGGTGTTVGTGMSNTNKILADITLNGCFSASVNSWWGYFAAEVPSLIIGPEWYLPSKDEVDAIYSTLGTTNLPVAGLQIWSSSEFDADNTWYFDGTLWQSNGLKSDDTKSIWPIRSF